MFSVGSDPFPAPVALQLFGGVSILVDGLPPQQPPPKKVYAVFARLALAPERRCARTHIAYDVWPEVDSESLRLYNLRRALTSARKVIGPHQDLLIQPVQDYLQINLDHATIDLITFDESMVSQDLARIEAAVRLYSGPLLGGFDEAWITHERQKRQSAFLRGIALLRSAARATNDIRSVIELCRIAVKVDPTLEREQRELMAALADSGDFDGASAAYKQYAKALKKELGGEPEAEIRELLRRIVMGEWEKNITQAAVPGRDRVCVTSGEFSRPITQILGRSLDAQKLCSMVRTNRLVTVIAAGGYGKTRLSLHVADIMNSEFEGGIWFVDLAPVTDPQFVLPAIMECLNVKEKPGASRLQALKTLLQTLRTLIILDNCEHLLEACGNVALSLLTNSAQLRVLATSRQSLGVTGEALFRLRPLASPDVDSGFLTDLSTDALIGTLTDAMQEKFPALSLFLQRAGSHGAFELTPSSISAVIRICNRLEGNPLALELAAAQTKIYSLEDLDRSLDDIFGTLVTNNPTVQPRQRTLKALIAWSFDLLPENEAYLLARLSIFRGSWTLATVTEVCSGYGIDRKFIPTLVSNLSDKSMIETIARGGGSMRFRLLEMVRVFAHDTLDAPNKAGEQIGQDASRVMEGYLSYYVEFARLLKVQLTTNDQKQALDQMEQERDNLRMALEHSIISGDAESALRLANSMWRYWTVRGYYSEGLTWFERALSIIPEASFELLCESYLHAGNIAYTALRLSEARYYFNKSLEYETIRGDIVFITSAQASLALVLESEGRYNEALELLFESVEILTRNGKVLLAAGCQSNIGNNYVGLGELNRAIQFYREAIGTFRNFSHTSDFTHAMVSYSEALAMNEEASEAIATLNETMPHIVSLGSVNDLPRALLVYVSVAVQRALFEDAACLLGAYTACVDSHRLTPSTLQRSRHDRDMGTTRDALGSRFQTHFDHGYEFEPSTLAEHLQRTFN